MFFNNMANVLYGLSAVYKLNNSLVDSLNGNNGTAIGGASTYATAVVSQGCSFVGLDSKYISIPHSVNNSFKDSSGNLTNFSISFWIKLNVINKHHGIISKRNTNGNSGSGDVEYIISVNSRNQPNCTFFNFTTPASNRIIVTSSLTFTTSGFNHVAITFNKDLLSNPFKIYINGVVDNLASFSQIGLFNNFNVVSQSLNIGVNKDSVSNDFEGIIDEIYLWKKKLNESEVAYIYNQNLSNQSII